MISRYREMAFLNKGIKIILVDKRQEVQNKVELHYEGGIISFVEYINRSKEVIHKPPIYIEGKKGDTLVEVSLQYNDGYNENIFSYANDINTAEGGTHLTGFRSALTR